MKKLFPKERILMTIDFINHLKHRNKRNLPERNFKDLDRFWRKRSIGI